MSKKPTYKELEQQVLELKQADSDRKQAEDRLVYEFRMREVLMRISSACINVPLQEVNQSINESLREVGEFLVADRAYIFDYDWGAGVTNNTFEWCRDGVSPQIENLQEVPLDGVPEWTKTHRQGKTMHLHDVSLLPEDGRLRQMLEPQQIKSLITIPLMKEKDCTGFIGFDSIKKTHAYSENEEKLLNILAEIIMNIAERKQTEEAIHKSEEKYRLLADNSIDVIWQLDLKLFFTFVSPSVKNMMGYTVEEWVGTRLSQHTSTKEFFNMARKALSSIKHYNKLKQLTFDAVMLKKDGTEIPVEITGKLLLNKKGLPIGLQGTTRDITKRKLAEEEREKLQTQLNQAQKMKSIGTMAGGFAHNFNNILMGVQGRTSMMMMDKDTFDPDYEHLKGIEEYVKNAVELTRDLLGFARGGKYEVRPADLNTLIKHENRMFGNTKKEIRIQGNYAKDLWTVEVDQGQIQQALLNLYVNAWQAMPGGGNLYIQTENVTLDEEYIKPFSVAPGKYVKLSVTDTGVGMDDATMEKIFDPFFTTKDVGQGSGLGLASVYGIIKNHDGFINVYSEKREGTTFNIYLPASEKEVVKEGPEPKRHDIQYGQGIFLLVDDENMIIEVGKTMLERLGYRVLTAGSGKEALDLYEKQKDEIDLVILDMIMPGMGGGETFDRLKAIDGDVKIILSSGYSINGQAKEILDRGCIGFIQKPFSMKELSRKVRDALDEGKNDAQQ